MSTMLLNMNKKKLKKEDWISEINDFYNSNGKETSIIKVQGAKHLIWTDNAILIDFFKDMFPSQNEKIDKLMDVGVVTPETREAIKEAIVSFFDHYLKSEKIPYPPTVVCHHPNSSKNEFYIPCTKD